MLTRNKLDIVQTDVVDDPTLQRSKNAICEKCNYNEAVFFQADEVRYPRTVYERKCQTCSWCCDLLCSVVW